MAPDEASRKAGSALATPGKWVSMGANHAAIWGECQGSGSKPYQTQVDISNVAFKCSCPSRKFPCKHGIGLLLLHAKDVSLFANTTMPDWVNSWLQQRTEKQEKKEEKEKKQADPAAQAKRNEQRQARVTDGIDELLLWIKDIFRSGIIQIPEKQHTVFPQLVKRMIDAQAPGLAALLKNISRINFYTEGWQSQFAEQMLDMYLLAKSWVNKAGLAENMRQDLMQRIGFTISQEELRSKDGIKDIWLVCGKQVLDEDGIVTEKFWLLGTKGVHAALVLQFIVRGQGNQYNFTAGMYIEAELVYYPGVVQQRALVKDWKAVAAATAPTAMIAHFDDLTMQRRNVLTEWPFLSSGVYFIDQVTPVLINQQWHLQDIHKRVLPIDAAYCGIWQLLALSGGYPSSMAIVYSENNAVYPLGVWIDQTYKAI